MYFIWKFLTLVLLYTLIFIPPVLRVENGALFGATFVAVFMLLFLVIIFSGAFIYSKILLSLNIRVLSRSGDIMKTDFGHNIKSAFLRGVTNLFADAFFNLIFILYLIAFAVFLASIADEVAKAVQIVNI